MILLFTDFGAEGPYLGQMEAVLKRQVPDVPCINVLSNAPTGDPVRSAYLLAAICRHFSTGDVFLCVVDPGVGGERLPVAVKADDQWFVGPDNGLFNTVALLAERVEWRIIEWRPDSISTSFHGRDLFAPIAACIARGEFSWASRTYPGSDLNYWPPSLPEIIYIDHYGNAISGIRYSEDFDGCDLHIVGGRRISQARTFCDVAEGAAFWYCNSMGLVEIAVNRGRADQYLALKPGVAIRFE